MAPVFTPSVTTPPGLAQGVEFRVNTFTTGAQGLPSVAMDADGDFVVAWESYGNQDGSAAGVFARRYNASGVAQGVEFQVNTFTTGGQRFPSVAMDADGDFVVTWSSVNQDGSNFGVYAQRYSAAGVAQGNEFRVNTFTTGAQALAVVAMDADGDFVVAWDSGGQDGSDYGVFAQRYRKPTPLRAVSRLDHAGRVFDLPLPLGGAGSPLGVECRRGSGASFNNYQVVLGFDRPVVSVGAVNVSSGQGNVSALLSSGNELRINLSGVADRQTLFLSLRDLATADGSTLSQADLRLGILVGDTNGNGTVSGADVAQVKSQVGMMVGPANFFVDVNISGTISGVDVAITKAAIGGTLQKQPEPPPEPQVAERRGASPPAPAAAAAAATAEGRE